MGQVPIQLLNYSDQAASRIRDDILGGRWKEFIPGRDRLSQELGINGRTVDRALSILEKEGLLQGQGPGRPRRIRLDSHQDQKNHKKLQIRFLLYEPADAMDSVMLEFRRQIESAGHNMDFAPETLSSLKQDPKLVAKMFKAHPNTAWIVSGASRPVLEWIASESSIPAFAIFGDMIGLPIAGVRIDKEKALKNAIHSLVDVGGHERIVLLVREERRVPSYGRFEQLFLNELKSRNLYMGSYNIPDWKENADGLADCLDKLYQITPPSAILVDDPTLCLPVLNNLARKNRSHNHKVSMIACSFHPSFAWCRPKIPHMTANFNRMNKAVVSWVNHITQGKEDYKQTIISAKFIGEAEITGTKPGGA